MRTSRWNKKTIIISLVILLGLFVIFSSRYNRYEVDTLLKNTKPEEVWEFVADFSKMRKLNPTILDFKITADHGNANHWKYSVIYKERLSHWPYWLNVANADFEVKKPKTPNQEYLVESKHRTCFLYGLYCLYSEGIFSIKQIGWDTFCKELVYYQCPPFMGNFCKEEVTFQRRAIMKNLTLQFSKKL